MSLLSLPRLFVSLTLFACTSVSGAPLVVNVAGMQSGGMLGDPGNTVLAFNVGANATVTRIDYLVNITASRTSWLSELTLYFSNAALSDGVYLMPGAGDKHSGTATYADGISLVDLDLDFRVGADGMLRLEFFDTFDDSASVDGVWNFGTITFDVQDAPGTVPEPGTALLMGAGLALAAYASRRHAGRKAA